MKRAKSVDDYLEINSRWANELLTLRSVMQEIGLPETLKWGAPTYCVNQKNIVGLGAFKSYVGLWFHQGVYLKDEAKVLINAQEGTTKALRQWRFTSVDDIDKDLVKAYVLEAIENQKAGKELKPTRAKTFDIAKEMDQALCSNDALAKAYFTLSFGKQKEYANYITDAKQESTRLKRLDKITPMIIEGVGLHDKYMK
jgi:uncharacterized protein YdeI (YjbR/CyaY-like superfamily)